MTVSEPTTLLSDAVLATLALALGVRLARSGPRAPQRAARLWAAAFLAGAAAALAGSVVHGFAGSLPAPLHAVLWKVVLVGCGLACSLLLAGSALAALRGTACRVATGLIGAQLALHLLLVARGDDIRIAAANGVVTIVALLALGLLDSRRHASRPAWLALALALSLAGITAQRLQVRPPGPFNHNDVCHALQSLALWPFYRVGRELRDRDRRARERATSSDATPARTPPPRGPLRAAPCGRSTAAGTGPSGRSPRAPSPTASPAPRAATGAPEAG